MRVKYSREYLLNVARDHVENLYSHRVAAFARRRRLFGQHGRLPHTAMCKMRAVRFWHFYHLAKIVVRIS